MTDYDTELADPYCLSRDELVWFTAMAPWHRLLVMGDSIAAGAGDPVAGYADQSWADRLAAVLPGAVYANLGHYGARTAQIRQEQLHRALAYGPDLAFVTAGANDAMRRSFDPVAVARDLSAIVAPLAGAGALVVTFGCFDLGRASFVPEPQRAALSDRLYALGDLTAAITERHGGVHVDLLRHPAFGDELTSADGLHINRRGHAIVLAEVVRALTRTLTGALIAR
jgi:lysophospholipase L1-like esterase